MRSLYHPQVVGTIRQYLWELHQHLWELTKCSRAIAGPRLGDRGGLTLKAPPWHRWGGIVTEMGIVYVECMALNVVCGLSIMGRCRIVCASSQNHSALLDCLELYKRSGLVVRRLGRKW